MRGKAYEKEAFSLFRQLIYTRSNAKCHQFLQELRRITDADTSFKNYFDRFYNQNLERFCLSQSPLLFQGPSITTSPLEKINDMIKQQITYASHPRLIVSKIEGIVRKMNKYNVETEKTKLMEVHKDRYLR